MNGMEMLMKSMGFDPAQIKQQFGEAMVTLQNRVMQMELSIKRIEMRQELIMRALNVDVPTNDIPTNEPARLEDGRIN